MARQRAGDIERAGDEVGHGAGPEPRLPTPQSRGAHTVVGHARHGIVAWVPEGVQTAISELGDSRVRIQVTVPGSEVDAQVQRKAAALGKDLKLPGFRRGKVPPARVI